MAVLQFNDTDNYAGLLQACERKLFNSNYGHITNSTKLKKDFTTRINGGLDWVTQLIQSADTRWQHGDSNSTTYNVFTDDLVDNQNDYRLDVEHVKLEGVSVKNADGNYYSLDPIDPNDIDRPIESQYATKGIPQFYDKREDAIFIYPAPDTTMVTATEGIKIYAQTTPEYFTFSDSTTKPGIPSYFHEAVADWACWNYAEDNDMDTKAEKQLRKVGIWENKITEHYSKRDKDDKPRMTASKSRNLHTLR